MSVDWDAVTYDRIADPLFQMGTEVLDRLELAGDERVLDAGCGSGRVTEQLLSRLPRGRVVALDSSLAMIGEARARLARFGDQVEYQVADLGQPLPIGQVDAVLSTATFHWVRDHAALFANLAAVLRPGGQLVAQCGGAGNIDNVFSQLERFGLRHTKVFATPEETVARLAAAGFEEVRAWLEPRPVHVEPGEPLETYLRTIVLREQVAALPEGDRTSFVRSIAGRVRDGRLNYVRLNIVARRGT